MVVLRSHALPPASQLEVHPVAVRALQHARAAHVVVHRERGGKARGRGGGGREDHHEDLAVLERLADARALVEKLDVRLCWGVNHGRECERGEGGSRIDAPRRRRVRLVP